MKFSNNYHRLGGTFYRQALPEPVVQPKLLLWNDVLAQELQITYSPENDCELLAQYFTGNKIFSTSQPLSQAYAGHQFAHFNPQLGDGRAHLLGELTDVNGQLRDVQLKGSGMTPFSRQGDGRCALSPALREYLMSEAMHALGVPTTRCLSVVATGELVFRDAALPGAIVTRVSASHLRVGTFQYFAARNDIDSLKKLTNFAIRRHFPQIANRQRKTTELTRAQVLTFFSAVTAQQVPLILSWLRVGFIHGVMNTDNTAISGETIDFGPCAMMNNFHRNTVFSSIDQYGRYAFGEQLSIMQWNMTRLAETLLPLLSDDNKEAIELIQPLLTQLAQNLTQGYQQMMAQKLGITSFVESDAALITKLIPLLESQALDYTQTFVKLTDSVMGDKYHHELKAVLGQWFEQWLGRIRVDKLAAQQLMQENNPLVIPRNHHVESVLKTSQDTGDMSDFLEFLTVLKQPYKRLDTTHLYQDPPANNDENYRTFCGT